MELALLSLTSVKTQLLITSSWWSFEGYEDNQLPDGQIADNAISTLKELKQTMSQGNNIPFFLAVGFHKPHLPFLLLRSTMYPSTENVELPKSPEVPKGFPPISSELGEITSYEDISPFFDMDKCTTDVQASFYGEECRIPDDYARKLRRAYYACVSYVDAQVGSCLLYTSPSPRDATLSRMPSSA